MTIDSDHEHMLASSSREHRDTSHERDTDSDTDTDDLEDAAKLLPDGRGRSRERSIEAEREPNWKVVRDIVLETAPTLGLTTVGLIFTGELLERVSEWQAFQRVDELIILVPMLNNLKGNLEMNLSARLATAANIGDLDTASVRKSMVVGSLSLLQVQALLVSALAAALSFLLGKIMGTPPQAPQREPPAVLGRLRHLFRLQRRVPRPSDPSKSKAQSGFREFIFLLVTSQAAASASGFILGSFMCSLIIICRRFSVDPDNIATPVAACLGDLLTLVLLALVGTGLIGAVQTLAPIAVAALLVGVLVMSIAVTARNPHVRSLLGSGWGPLIGAMVISSGAGMVLDHYVQSYEGFGVLAIVTGGLPGSVGSVFVSRLSTALHAHGSPGATLHAHTLAPSRPTLVGLTLFFVTLPVTVLFIVFLRVAGWVLLPASFILLFIFFFSLSVAVSLVLAKWITIWLWKTGRDPDTYALPIQSSLVDLISQLLLVACYIIAGKVGADVGARPKQ
ncbi:hypothetical protein AURDEDRAFT_150809 [Auricularia subglabra TFB-10046 SS5]|nr:hypothetical protein AURDEDRAFT_150809 [Auricularia subglabra TFB-10046 SS5]